MVALEERGSSVLLPVRAYAGARRNTITGEYEGALKVAVTQAPEKGKANKAIVELLCKTLNLKRSQIELQSGAASLLKRFIVRDITLDELQQRVLAALE